MAGLTAAYVLASSHEVAPCEAAGRLGGHAPPRGARPARTGARRGLGVHRARGERLPEKHASGRPGRAAYAARTSGFFPPRPGRGRYR
ncbi:hypothetical protein ACFWGM_12400 [Streptomyces roseolus]|uniref:hypothetical protein n=1 Tax=Streptomyces roseolus TaxID=67358 RepID=UPI00362F338C